MDLENFLPGISVDCVIFGFHANKLKVLLSKLKGVEEWMLPGGFIKRDQDLNTEAGIVLQERTGLVNIFLRQFYVFGDVARNEVPHIDQLFAKGLIDAKQIAWFHQRFISVGYYALVEYSKVTAPAPDEFSEYCAWVPIAAVPPLLLDHEAILARAYNTLKKELHAQPIGFNLLPEEFTMTELQSLYETILQRKLDRRNFRRKMLAMNILKDTEKRRTGLGHRAPIIYTFDREQYAKKMEMDFRASGFF